MKNFDDIIGIKKQENNKYWPEIPNFPYRLLINGGSGTGKTNALLNILSYQPDIDKIYLYVKDPYEDKYDYLINKRQKVGIKHFNDPNAFIEFSNDINDLYSNIDMYNPKKDRKVIIVFDDMIAEKLPNQVTELFIRSRKMNIAVIFISQSYFRVPKDIRLNSTHYFLFKIPNKRELTQIAVNHSSDIDFKDFKTIYNNATKDKHSFLVIDTTLPADNEKRFRKNININTEENNAD